MGKGIKPGTVPNRPTGSAVRLQRISLQIVRIAKRAGNTDTCQKDAPQTKTALKKLMKIRKKKDKMPTRSPRKLTTKKVPVTAHFVVPAQFVTCDKMCTLNGTFCHTVHTLSPENDKMCSLSQHILSPLREHQKNCAHIYVTSRLVYGQCITSGVP